LLVLDTGTGKTRTVIALCDVLMQCNWVKRVLFLADRVSLVKQALNAFKKFLPNSSPVNLIEDHKGQGRVCVSTYQTMMGLINETNEEKYFVPYESYSIPTKFTREGIKYSELSEQEKQQWDEIEWSEENEISLNEIDASALNNWLFNMNTVDKVLEYLMTRGIFCKWGR